MANVGATARDIILVTKTVTQNQGNQALSVAWRDLLKQCYPDHAVRPVERAPAYLKRYRASTFAAATDPVAAFDKVAQGLIAQLPRNPAPKPPINDEIRHDARIRQVVRFRRLRRLLSLRSRLAGLGLAKRAYLERLALFPGSALVVVNPAGEFQSDATDTAIAYLLDVRCAQLLGIPTAMVNLSFEVTDPTVRTLAAHVLDQCDLLELRDSESRTEYAAAGGRRSPLVLPDGALLTPPSPPTTDPAQRLPMALAINGLQVHQAGLEDDWLALLDRLIASGHRPVLTSNEWSTDEPFWGPLLNDRQMTAVGQRADYREYMALLGTFDVVVSSRLHTCVLAILAGSVVVPVESGTFKLTGFFRQAGFTSLPIRLGTEGWQDAIVNRIAEIRADRDAALATQTACRDAARRHLQTSLHAAFAALGIEAQSVVAK
ncbi:polysaccharide pyruvyl transferase family protein [Polymorphobacter sp.]|uniref:polysaccharide pyruvyl transferase family protein n=1 Tax=Polymorphobacter sp. TaxID=1909290 RepID=UPI003F6EB162